MRLLGDHGVRSRRSVGASRFGVALASAACLLAGWAVVGAAAAVAPGLGVRSAAARSTVAVYVTSSDGSRRLSRLIDVHFRGGSGGGPNGIVVRPRVAYQALTAGFGVAMTDTSAWLLQDQLPVRPRDRVMRRLFSLGGGGIGLSYLRVPIGGSDYVVHVPYTYDDLPQGQRDPSLKHFSLRHDRAYVLPMIRQAFGVNPSLTIVANPWSPPAWMKTDDSLIPSGPTSSMLRPDAYGPLARYLVKFLEGYARAGVSVRQLGVENSPLVTEAEARPSIPSMYLPAQAEAKLIARYVGPALRRAHLHPSVLAGDSFYPKGVLTAQFPNETAYIPTVLGTAARRYVRGLAFKCYFGDATAGAQLHRRYPHLPQFETECASYLSDITPAQMAIRTLRNWAQGVQLFNAAVDQNFGPKVGQACFGMTPPHLGQQCIAPVVVDRRTHTYRLTSDYWQLGQFSRFIRLGARRIYSTTPNSCVDGEAMPAPACGVEDVAFRNPDGSIVLVATTNDGNPHRITVTDGNKTFSYLLHNGDVATFVWHR